MFARRYLITSRYLVTGAVLTILVAGCGSSHHPGDPVSFANTPAAPSRVLMPGGTASSTLASSSPTASQVSIPPYLCEATDRAQNAADAYMGALSAGNEKQAVACVLPGSVPVAVTHGLLATAPGTAAYLPRDGVDGPTVFGYQGKGKSIDVTVTKLRDARFWVTKVAVGPAR